MLPAFLYSFFHNETNDRTEKGIVNIPEDPKDWPESWKKIYYKKYKFFDPLPLPDVSGTIRTISSERRSVNSTSDRGIFSREDIAYILKCGYGLQDDSETTREGNRMVPSGGRRYPLELYLVLFNDLSDYKKGVYHYGIMEHVLEPVHFNEVTQREIKRFTPIHMLENTQGMVCIVSVFSRTTEKYGSRGYRYILLEAGHVAQNILLGATERHKQMVPVGGTNEEEIERFLGLTSPDERLVYTLFF